MSRVLLLTLVYEPDTVSTATMITGIAKGLQAAGHEITVMTTIPHYNLSEAVRADPAFSASLWRPLRSAREDEIRVYRVYMPPKGRRVWGRLIHYVWFQAVVTVLALWKRRPGWDVVLVTSPPVTLGLTGIFLASILRARFIYDVRELWPDAPIRMGLIRNKLLIRLIYGVESLVYRRAAAISTIARTFNERLIARGVPSSKLYWAPNFAEVDKIIPGEKRNAFSLKHDLVATFLILYAGNIGLTQGLEILVDVAFQFRDDPNVRILIVGDGAGRRELERAIKASGLDNIVLMGFQPSEVVPDLYAASDVSVIVQRAGFSHDTVPSKLYTSMAAGRPVVLAAEPETEAAVVLKEADAGLRVPPESPLELVQAIRRLKSDSELRRRLGAQGRDWVVQRYSRQAVLLEYDRMIRAVVAPTQALGGGAANAASEAAVKR